MMASKNRRRNNFWLLVSVACFIVFVYPVLRMAAWYSGYQFSLAEIFLLWTAAMACLWFSFRGRKTWLRYFTLHWLGVSFVFLSLTLLYDLVRLFLPLNDQLAVKWLFAGGLLLCLFAVAASHFISVKKLRFNSRKIRRPYRFVQMSDVHIGSRQGAYMDKIVRRVNTLKPDYVVITGDLVDTSAVGKTELSALRELSGVTYFVTGNHERYVDLDRILADLRELGVTVLRNEHVEIDDVHLIGIDDADHPEQVGRHLPHIEIDHSKYRILLYHRPAGWASAIEHGVDLMLSGHTHNGQIFPFNYLVKQQFRHIKGLYRQGEAHLYVSCGTGTWGPLMRLGSMNEITCIDLLPDP